MEALAPSSSQTPAGRWSNDTGWAVLIVAASALLALGALTLLFGRWSSELLENGREHRRASLVQQVSMARNAIEPVVAQVRDGSLSPEQGLVQVRDLVRRMTFADPYGRNYIFMSAYDGTMLVQPYEPQKELTSQWGLQDVHGVYIVRELIRSARSNPEGAFVSYWYPPPQSNEPEEKLAYVVGIPELNCYIGTGMYVGKAQREQQQLLERAKYWTGGIVLLLLVPVTLALWQIISRNRALAQSRHDLDQVFHGISEAILVHDTDGRVLEANRRASEMYGLPPEKLVGRLIPEFVADVEGQLERVPVIIEALVTQGPQTFEWTGRSLVDGTLLDIEVALRIGYWKGRQAVFATIRDTADRKAAERARARAEDALLLAKEQAEKANLAKDRFIAVLSHELRTPLTPVLLGLSAMDENTELPAEVREELRAMKRNVELEARLIDDLLDVNRISHGKLALQKTTVDLHQVIHEAVRIAGAELCEKQIEVSYQLEAECYHVRGDPARLNQVFWNLARNSARYTPQHGRFAIRSANVNAHEIEIELTDTGPGIDPELFPRLFRPFEQGPASGTAGSLGLGLTISRHIVEAHGGAIWANPGGKGTGASFTITLPTTAPPAPVAAGQTPAPAALANRSILLVEDNAPTLAALKRILKSMGHQVRGCCTKAEAIRAAQEAEYDVLLSDIGLPDGSGWDLLPAIAGRIRRLRIALSGYGMEGDVERSRQAGFDHHLTKPVDVARLRAVLQASASGIDSGANGVTNGPATG